jgi:MFS family permease
VANGLEQTHAQSEVDAQSSPSGALPESTGSDMRSLFQNRNFRLLFAGELISSLGDQASAVALPWLMLLLTRDPLALGTVIACSTVPRALLILSGGALVDRLSARSVLLGTRIVDTCLMAALVALVFTGLVQSWMVYSIAVCSGIAAAFSQPASSTMAPQIVDAKHLQAANGLVSGVAQVAMLTGPILAGILISFAARVPVMDGRNTHGVTLAFAVDGISYAVSGLMLLAMRLPKPWKSVSVQSASKDIRDAGRVMFADLELRTLLMYFAAIAIFVAGPLQVALPLLANTTLRGDSSTFGTLMSSFAFGTLVGMGLSAVRPKLGAMPLGLTVLLLNSAVGLTILPLGHVSATWQAASLLLVIGGLSGFVEVALLTWIQKRVPENMLGRATSIVGFVVLCVLPMGTLISGVVLRHVNIGQFFLVVGGLLNAIVILGLVFTPIRQIRNSA